MKPKTKKRIFIFVFKKEKTLRLYYDEAIFTQSKILISMNDACTKNPREQTENQVLYEQYEDQ